MVGAMSVVTHPAAYVHGRALAASFMLHALVAAWMLYRPAPVEILPQQMVAVTIIAAPVAEPAQSRPRPQPEEMPQERVKDNVPEAEKPVRNEQAEVVLKQEKVKPQPKKKPRELAALAPSAGNTVAAKPSMQLATTTPQFDTAYLNNPAPAYPPQARRRGMQGSVLLGVLVTQEGAAKSVTVEESSGFALLDASAREAVSRWKFVPARRGREAVEARVMVPIDFKLQ
jgi:protein TonB